MTATQGERNAASLVDLRERTVLAVLERGAREHPDQEAITDGTRTVSYAELLESSRRVAGGLRVLGVGAGDSVALMLDNSLDHVLAWFGCSLLNAAEVPLNTAFMSPQISYVIGHCGAEVLIIEERYLDRLRAVAGELLALKFVVVRGDPGAASDLPFTVLGFGELASGPDIEPVRARPQDVLGILYTSGTTGMPKGVMVTQAQTYGRMWPLGPGAARPGDRTLVVLPIYHVIGQCRGLYNTLIADGTVVLKPRFSASAFWDSCRESKITYAPLVGVMASYLLRQPPRDNDRDHQVTHIALGTTSPEVEEFRERFGIREVTVSYGLTEAGGVLVGPAEPTGCGYLRPDFEGRLVDESDIEVAPGEVGELVLRPVEPWTTMAGYFKMPEETLSRWRNLWLHTGDLMTQRDDGMYLFVARRAERIRVRGENVSPADVETHVAAHPSVAECAVIGLDSAGGEAGAGEQEILAAVVARNGAGIDPEELLGFLADRLPGFALPRYVAVLEALPRTDSTQRVQKNVIAARPRESFWDRRKAAEASGLM
jgi:carnitine-CoA ligase